jgi:hypothetical protein
MPLPSETRLPLSAILNEIAETPEPTLSVAQLTERFGGRALGALMLVFALPCCLFLPPGTTTVLGLPLLLLAPQLMIGARAPWLPASIKARTVTTADLAPSLRRVIPWLRKVEAVSKPRLPFLFGAVGQGLIGLTCTLLAFVLILPILGANMLPGAAVSVLSLSLILRDGVLALIGYALVIASAGVLVIALRIALAFLERIIALAAS